MKQHLIPGAIAAVVAGTVVAAVHQPAPPPQIVKVAPAAGLSFGEASQVSDAKSRLLAARTWPEMDQHEIDSMTAKLKEIAPKLNASPVAVSIFCINDRCEDLALNLDNAFESAHARFASQVLSGSMIPPGIVCSSKWLCDIFNDATGGRYSARVDAAKNSPGEYIAIGYRQKTGL